MSKDYEVKILHCNKELTARERVLIKDTGDAVSLDEATQENGSIIIEIDTFAKLSVHNEKADNKDYTKFVLIAKDGTKYATSSEAFVRSFEEIYDEMLDAGESEFSVKVFRKESKNYKGKEFITCSIA